MAYQGVAPVLFESVSAVTATNSVDIGTRRSLDGNDYVYVYNAGTTQICPGQGAILSAVSGYSVTVSSVTGVGGFFGFAKHATLTTATYGWLLVRGFVTMSGCANTAIVAGAPLVPADNGGSTHDTGALTAIAHGMSQIATISGGAGYGFVRCLGA